MAYKHFPITKDELQDIIFMEIAFQGHEANLNCIDTSKITDMSYLFAAISFNGDISKWDVSNVTDMSHMFYGSTFDGDISMWDVSSVEDGSFIFANSQFTDNYPSWYNSIPNKFIAEEI